MPITFHYIGNANLVICIHSGTVQDIEFFTSYKSLFECKQFNTSLNILIDLCQADSSIRNPDFLKVFSDFVSKKYKECTSNPKVAVVAPKYVSFGLARMFQNYANSIPWIFKVFRDTETALAWLGLPDDIMDNLKKDSQSNYITDK